MQLESRRADFEALGVHVAGMTYDSEEKLMAFHTASELGYPLLRDVDAKHVDALGVRNESFGPDSFGFGVPHPGILFISPSGEVLSKFAVAGYRQRPPLDDVLAAVRAASAK